jgi:hypothetical protein
MEIIEMFWKYKMLELKFGLVLAVIMLSWFKIMEVNNNENYWNKSL